MHKYYLHPHSAAQMLFCVAQRMMNKYCLSDLIVTTLIPDLLITVYKTLSLFFGRNGFQYLFSYFKI